MGIDFEYTISYPLVLPEPNLWPIIQLEWSKA
jgi:hypothetical protein